MARFTTALLFIWAAASVMTMITDAVEDHDNSHRRFLRVRVRTVCQGNRLTLGCPRGFRIHVLAAFYGHSSRRICPSVLRGRHHHRGKEAAVHCSAKGATDLVCGKCNNHTHCRLYAVSRVFGNPCRRHKVRKYLRVRYTCKFHNCLHVAHLQTKLVRLIERYGKLARKSYSYWRRRRYSHRRRLLVRKLNHLRKKFHFCFQCRRGCSKLRYYLKRMTRAEIRIQKLLHKLLVKSQSDGRHVRWHASRWFLKRKLVYLHARRRIIMRRLRNCTRVCHY